MVVGLSVDSLTSWLLNTVVLGPQLLPGAMARVITGRRGGRPHSLAGRWPALRLTRISEVDARRSGRDPYANYCWNEPRRWLLWLFSLHCLNNRHVRDQLPIPLNPMQACWPIRGYSSDRFCMRYNMQTLLYKGHGYSPITHLQTFISIYSVLLHSA
jgi:hypothetical protein